MLGNGSPDGTAKTMIHMVKRSHLQKAVKLPLEKKKALEKNKEAKKVNQMERFQTGTLKKPSGVDLKHALKWHPTTLMQTNAGRISMNATMETRTRPRPLKAKHRSLKAKHQVTKAKHGQPKAKHRLRRKTAAGIDARIYPMVVNKTDAGKRSTSASMDKTMAVLMPKNLAKKANPNGTAKRANLNGTAKRANPNGSVKRAIGTMNHAIVIMAMNGAALRTKKEK